MGDVQYGPGADQTRPLKPGELYRLTLERAGFSLLAFAGLPAIAGYSVWRPNALRDAWAKIGTSPYAYAISPVPDADDKVTTVDVRIKNTSTLPRGATVGQMVESFNILLGTWAKVFNISGAEQTDTTQAAQDRAKAEVAATEAGAGRTPLSRGLEGFGDRLKKAGKVVTFAAVAIGVLGALYVLAQFRKGASA